MDHERLNLPTSNEKAEVPEISHTPTHSQEPSQKSRRSGRKPNEIRNFFEIVEEREGTHPIVICKFCKNSGVADPVKITARVRNLRSHLKACHFYTGPPEPVEPASKKPRLTAETLAVSVGEEISSRTIRGYSNEDQVGPDGALLKIVVLYVPPEKQISQFNTFNGDSAPQKSTKEVIYESLIRNHKVRKRNIAFVEVPVINQLPYFTRKLVASWRLRSRAVDVVLCIGALVSDSPELERLNMEERLEKVAMEVQVPVVNGLMVGRDRRTVMNKLQLAEFGSAMAALTVEMGMLQDNIETSKCPIPAN